MDRRPLNVVIPVRGGSKGIPKKNVAVVGGCPLIAWTVAAAVGATSVDRVIVSTDSAEIAAVARLYGGPRVEIHARSAESATDTASSESALLEAVRDLEVEGAVALVQATSPLLSSGVVDEIADRLSTHDSALTVVRRHQFLWADEDAEGRPVNYSPDARPRRQDWSGHLIETGAVYATSVERLLASGVRIGGRVGLVETDEAEAVEIDSPTDLVVTDALLRTHRIRPAKVRSGPVRLVVTDVDGVLTDNGLTYGTVATETKTFSARDGKGFQLLREAGVRTALLTSEDHESVAERARKLRVDDCVMGSTDKLADLVMLGARYGVPLSQIAYVGDDVHDVPALVAAGVSGAPGDARPEATDVADHVVTAAGGSGAFRQFTDHLFARSIPVRGGV
ncbi:acylneuraminate cytidylyltransferase [Blastococcus atacamensis]|uniref:acylneuraminate cytidylyltransferase n=1 Tax=Blastococcus atacamensis TaxID=2070508 RepID=UPI000CECA54C|nr:acylneuraminate cytidylyltransferase [Blastococcus atacamensis]